MSYSSTQRVIALVDMDCFYCQVETRLNPNLKGKPVAVVQYNQWKGGGIIAVNYEARERGVTRYMRGAEAKEKCSDIVLVPVPTIRGKADLSNYRDAGDEVAKVFSEFSDCVQRASIDEAYLDLTKAVEDYIRKNVELKAEELTNTYVVGHCDLKIKNEEARNAGLLKWLELLNEQKLMDAGDYKLAIGGIIVEKMRSEIKRKTGFHCSAGIAHNKILSKLTAGLHKPNKQTILPQDSIPELFETLPIYKVRNLGGKLGKLVSEKLSINYMSELYKFSLQELQKKFDEKTGTWLYNIARGIDLEPVTSRLQPESIGCCKNFTGKAKLTTKSEVRHWLTELASEISERLCKDLERNKRRAKLLTVSFYQDSPMSRCGALNSYNTERIVNDALDMLKKFNIASVDENSWNPPIKYLGLSASKFTEELSSIEKYFKNPKNNETIKNADPITSINEYESLNPGKPLKVEVKDSGNLLSNYTVKDNLGPGTSKSASSFFMNFIAKHNINIKIDDSGEDEEIEEFEEEEEIESTCKSLREIFPETNEVQPDIAENLPEAIQEKYKIKTDLKINENEYKKESENIVNSSDNKKENDWKSKKICSKCGKDVLLTEFLEHTDYHAALDLHSELNKTINNAKNNEINKIRGKDLECQSKRKKKEVLTPSKKIKNIESFFRIVPKS